MGERRRARLVLTGGLVFFMAVILVLAFALLRFGHVGGGVSDSGRACLFLGDGVGPCLIE